ncbi:hypothetical protein MNBD_GAMMA11-3350 [hydrothermal vent metagenome]|uniref:OmpA-like domain-containing protein n=1 Tax=hydrothermal vent metagenome TaxID=652676 RepID=A0A3B0X9R8_9ZZZZ
MKLHTVTHKITAIFNPSLLLIYILLSNPALAAPAIKLSTDKPAYFSGEIMSVSFSSSAPLENDAWIGFYRTSQGSEAITRYINYHYIYKNLEKGVGTYEYSIPADEGDYELRVISSEHGKVLTSIPVKVVKIDPKRVSLSILTKTIKPAQALDVRISSTFTMSARAWVGIFKSDISKDTHTGYDSYNYIRDKKEGVLHMKAPNTIGDYELRVYAADPGALIKQLPFHVGKLNFAGLAFTLAKKKFDPEEDIVIQYTGHADLTDHAWLGLFKADAKKDTYSGYLQYQYLYPKTGGQVVLKAPATRGNYLVKLFYNDYGPELLSPEKLTVTSSIDDEYLKNAIDKKGRVALYGIYFDTDKSTVKTASYPLIKQIANMLKANPQLKIRIEGHTDSQGDEKYNQALSEKRSAAVSKLLTSKHAIPGTQLESRGYGESKPAGSNDNAAGRAKNRRVELVKL